MLKGMRDDAFDGDEKGPRSHGAPLDNTGAKAEEEGEAHCIERACVGNDALHAGEECGVDVGCACSHEQPGLGDGGESGAKVGEEEEWGPVVACD